MKHVSYKVAKAIKEAGFPQDVTPYQYVTKDYSTFKEGEVIDSFFQCAAGDNVIDMPSVLEAWLWLWREKQIIIKVTGCCCFIEINGVLKSGIPDKEPEEMIAKNIEWLVQKGWIRKL